MSNGLVTAEDDTGSAYVAPVVEVSSACEGFTPRPERMRTRFGAYQQALRSASERTRLTLQLAGEWIGVSGPRATLMSRLTVAAVGLVLVSGVSLVMSSGEIAGPLDPAQASVEGEVIEYDALEETNSPILKEEVRVLPLKAASIEPASFEEPASPRGAWLQGNIEFD